MSEREAIMARHSKDLIVGECKNGPTWGGGHLRLDYWVLRRSWSKPAMIGYESKSGRRDFLSDNKWQSYLPLCNELWFIAPKDAIKPEELPETVGLLRLAGSRLVTVRKAVWREIEPPVDLLVYILMCRARIEREGREDDGRLAFWQSWLEQKVEKREIGYRVSKGLREMYERDVRAAQRENERLRSENASLAPLRDALKARGIEWRSWSTVDDVEKQIKAPRWTRERIANAHEALGELLNGAEVT